MLVLELVISYPDDVVAEKFSSLIVSDALKLGWVIAATLKTATSPLPGTPPPQFVLVLKSVPVLLQVLLAACADRSGKKNASTRTKMALDAGTIERHRERHRMDRLGT